MDKKILLALAALGTLCAAPAFADRLNINVDLGGPPVVYAPPVVAAPVVVAPQPYVVVPAHPWLTTYDPHHIRHNWRYWHEHHEHEDHGEHRGWDRH